MSNVRELRHDLVDKVLELGVGAEFLEHPAFIPVLGEVDSLLSSMNIADPERVHVSEYGEKIVFEYKSDSGDRYSFELSASETTIRCVKVEEPHSFVGNDGSTIRRKEAIEKIARIDDGEVLLTTNYGSLNNVGCDNVHYNLSSSVEKRIYDKNGVMREREHKHYGPRKGEGYIHRVGSKELLSFARWVPNYETWNDSYSSRTLLRREKLDTAVLVYQDRDTRHEYYGVVPLHQEHGLRDMYIANGYNTYPVPEVVIHPLMESEIEKMISKESDERVATGLREYAKGRTSYSYSSNDSGEYSGSKRM